MSDLLVAGDESAFAGSGISKTVYDMTMGTSQMLTCMEERLKQLDADADVTVFGQEFNPFTFGIAKADMLIRGGVDIIQPDVSHAGGIWECRKIAAMAEAGILDRTVFIGKIPYEETPRYLALSRVAVAPKISLSEGDGKLYNYMSMGMGIACFDRSVSREILGDAGLYAPMKDTDALAEKLAWLLENPAEAEELGRKARIRAENWSIHENARKIDAFYRKQADERKTH